MLFCALCLLGTNLHAVSVSQDINENSVWKNEMSPIVIEKDIVIGEGVTLSIEAGTIVKFKDYFHLLVKGSLIAQGTKSNLVVFTSAKARPAVNDWKGIIFYGAKSNGLLSYCKISYSYKNICWQASPKIEHCSFINNKYAVYCANNAAPRIVGNFFTRNTYGIYSDFSSPYIKGNNIVMNYYGIYSLFSSSPLIGDNRIEKNEEAQIYFDESLGENKSGAVSNYVWGLIKEIF